MYEITYNWPEFNIDLAKMNAQLKTLIGSNYDGMRCTESSIFLMLFEASAAEETQINAYWNALTPASFNPTTYEIISSALDRASFFGRNLIKQAMISNVATGISQAGKTKQVADYCANIKSYLEMGSLYAVIDELNEKIESEIPEELQPFITIAVLTTYRNQVLAYLGLPIS